MRLFAAIQLSDEMRSSLVELMHDLKSKGVKGNYTPARNLHLTMCFIGEVSDARPVKEALAHVHYKPFKLALTEMGNFGDLLWVGSKGGQSINTLAADIRKALDQAGIPFDDKKFTPHITLIRKSVGNPGKMPMPKAGMMVKKVSLMKSENVKGKQVYTEIYSF